MFSDSVLAHPVTMTTDTTNNNNKKAHEKMFGQDRIGI